VLDKMTYAANEASLAPVADKIRLVRGDVADADVVDGLVAETVEHAVRVAAEIAAMARLDAATGPRLGRLELPQVLGGIDLGSLYDLADALAEQGVGARRADEVVA
jgi:hypothetical protein